MRPMPLPPARRSNRLVKVGVGLVVIAALGALFIRSVRQSRAAPYTVSGEELRGWALAFEPASGPNAPILTLRPPPALAHGLFDQIFKRAMESLNTPSEPAIPLLLQGEFERAFAG